MVFVTRRPVLRLLGLGGLALLLVAPAAHAQRGGCMRQQLRQSSFQTQPSSSFQTQPSSGQSLLYAQQYALQQYALQAQLNALPRNAFLAQLNAGQVNAAPLDGQAMVNVLQARLDDLQDYIAEQQQNGRLSSAKLRTLRQQEKAIAKQLSAAERRLTSSQRRPSY